MNRYFDKNGKEIMAGMYIMHNDGTVEEVFGNWDGDDIGVNASNPNYKGDMMPQIYPLIQFNLNEWVVVDKQEEGEPSC